MFEYTEETFKKIDPAKKFSSFTFTDIAKQDIHLYIQKGEVVRIDGVFYMYAGSTVRYSSEKTKSYILIKDRNKEIYKQII